MTGQNKELKFDKAPFEDFFRKDSNVICSIMFGSAQNGIITPGSDLDIAVLLHTPPKGKDFLNYYYKVCNINSHIEVIDLVVLNTANTILAFEALKGKYLCKNDPEKTAEFFSITCREYEDIMSNIEYQYSLRKENDK